MGTIPENVQLPNAAAATLLSFGMVLHRLFCGNRRWNLLLLVWGRNLYGWHLLAASVTGNFQHDLFWPLVLFRQ